MLMVEKLIINFAPTGMIPTKQMNPNVPVYPQEIVEQVHEAYEVGITIAHLHARDKNGVPTYKREVYREIVEGVRKYCPELVVCLSLSGRNFNEFEKRSEPLELLPDMASLTLSSLNFTGQASVNAPGMIKALAGRMQELGVSPELEIFDLGMINYAHYLIKKGLITPPYYFNIITGNIASLQTDLAQVGMAIQALPSESYWALGGIGNDQLKANAIAIATGGGVRTGLEDNLYADNARSILATNIMLIKVVHQIAKIHQRPVMTGKEFGELGFYI